MQQNDEQRLRRFSAYADAFEVAYATDDWSVLEPFFTPDASSELNGSRVDGRPGVLGSFRDGVAMFDRRFDSRTLEIIEGPEIADGIVRIKTVNRYERAGLEPLELVGEEWFHFEGDRIARHVDRVVNVADVMEYLARHGEALKPMATGERREIAAES
jgi:hypothetical protein